MQKKHNPTPGPLELKIVLPLNYEMSIEKREDDLVTCYRAYATKLHMANFDIHCTYFGVEKTQLVVEKSFFRREPIVKKNKLWNFSNGQFEQTSVLLLDGKITLYREEIGKRAANKNIILSQHLMDQLFNPLDMMLLGTYRILKKSYTQKQG